MGDGGGLLCVHAHPDDETITTGGVLRLASDRGLPADVVTCTDGALGEIVGEGMDPDEVRPRLAEVRSVELARALELLGVGAPRFLGYRDSGMMGTDGNDDERSFWRAPLDQAVERLVTHIRSLRPRVLVTYDPFGVYGHPDHIQAHRVTVLAREAAATPLLYPDAGEPWEVPRLFLATIVREQLASVIEEMRARGLPGPFDEMDGVDDPPIGAPAEQVAAVVDVTSVLDVKRAALRAHHSQIGPDSFFLNTPADLERRMFGRESFLSRDVAPGERLDDLFAGL